MESVTTPLTSTAASFFAIVRNPLKFRIFLLKNLPAAYFSGLRMEEVNESEAVVTIPFKWFTKNPFRSTYFACLSMAAEMSTGLLAMAHIYKRSPRISSLVLKVEGIFHKKATGRTRFICRDGHALRATIQLAIETGEGQSIRCHAAGINEVGEMVAEFWITWSFKAKRSS